MKRIIFIALALMAVTSWADTYYKSVAFNIASVNQEGKTLIVYKTSGTFAWQGNKQQSPRYFKDIYIARNDSVVLLKTIEGKVIPPQPERVEWPK